MSILLFNEIFHDSLEEISDVTEGGVVAELEGDGIHQLGSEFGLVDLLDLSHDVNGWLNIWEENGAGESDVEEHEGNGDCFVHF